MNCKKIIPLVHVGKNKKNINSIGRFILDNQVKMNINSLCFYVKSLINVIQIAIFAKGRQKYFGKRNSLYSFLKIRQNGLKLNKVVSKISNLLNFCIKVLLALSR